MNLTLTKHALDGPKGEEIFQELCLTVANGGTPIQVAQKHKIHYGALMDFIRSDPALESRYLKACADRQEWGREAVLKEMRALALVRVNKIFNDDGTIKPPSEWPEGMAHTISNLEVSEITRNGEVVGEVKKIKFWDKTKALEMMAKNLQLLNTKVEVEHKTDLAELVQASWGDDVRVVHEPPKQIAHAHVNKTPLIPQLTKVIGDEGRQGKSSSREGIHSAVKQDESAPGELRADDEGAAPKVCEPASTDAPGGTEAA